MAKCKGSLALTILFAASAVMLWAPYVNAHPGVFVDVETCEALSFESELKYVYLPNEPVYVRGKTQNYSEVIDIYLIADIDWSNGQVIPSRIPETLQHVTTNGTGHFGPSILWAAAQPGKYDICIDTNNNGIYNPERDALWNNNVQVTAGFFVLPEYPLGGLLAVAACFAAFAILKRNRPAPLPTSKPLSC